MQVEIIYYKNSKLIEMRSYLTRYMNQNKQQIKTCDKELIITHKPPNLLRENLPISSSRTHQKVKILNKKDYGTL